MTIVIDRFEGQFAVCESEDKSIIDIEINKLPEGAKEGDVLFVEGESITINNEATKMRKKKLQKMMDDLWE